MTGEATGDARPDITFLEASDVVAKALRDGRDDPEVVDQALRTAYEELSVAQEEISAQQDEMDRLVSGERTSRWAQERLISLLPVAVVVTDQHGTIRSANAAAAELLGVRLDRLMRKPLLVFVTEEHRPVIRRFLNQLLGEAVPDLRLPASLRVRGGEKVSAELAATVHQTPRGVPDRVQVTWLLLAHHGLRSANVDRDGARLAQALASITQLPLHTPSTQQTLHEVARLCRYAFAGGVAVSVTLGEPMSPDLVATDSKLAQSLDGAQVMAGEGPCHDAWEHGETVSADDLLKSPRWPRWHSQLGAGTHLRSCAATPIRVADRVVGVVNVYSEGPGLAAASNLLAVELLSTTIAAILHELDLRAELEGVTAQLQTALASRATIDQAKGILMARHQCDADAAFRILAKVSSSANVKLRVIAEQLVEEAARGGTRGRGGR